MRKILLKIIGHDVLIEPTFQQLTGESLHERTANITNEARVDIAARGLWISGQRAFFDIRVSQEINKAYEINEREKKDNIIYPVGHDSPWWHGKENK